MMTSVYDKHHAKCTLDSISWKKTWCFIDCQLCINHLCPSQRERHIVTVNFCREDSLVFAYSAIPLGLRMRLWSRNDKSTTKSNVCRMHVWEWTANVSKEDYLSRVLLSHNHVRCLKLNTSIVIVQWIVNGNGWYYLYIFRTEFKYNISAYLIVQVGLHQSQNPSTFTSTNSY